MSTGDGASNARVRRALTGQDISGLPNYVHPPSLQPEANATGKRKGTAVSNPPRYDHDAGQAAGGYRFFILEAIRKDELKYMTAVSGKRANLKFLADIWDDEVIPAERHNLLGDWNDAEWYSTALLPLLCCDFASIWEFEVVTCEHCQTPTPNKGQADTEPGKLTQSQFSHIDLFRRHVKLLKQVFNNVGFQIPSAKKVIGENGERDLKKNIAGKYKDALDGQFGGISNLLLKMKHGEDVSPWAICVTHEHIWDDFAEIMNKGFRFRERDIFKKSSWGEEDMQVKNPARKYERFVTDTAKRNHVPESLVPRGRGKLRRTLAVHGIGKKLADEVDEREEGKKGKKGKKKAESHGKGKDVGNFTDEKPRAGQRTTKGRRPVG